MLEKNYLTKEEQNIWRYIEEKEIIDNELIRQIFPEINANKSNKLLYSLHKKGYIQRVRKNLYFNPKNIKDYHSLAIKFKTGYIGLNSALRHYNLIDYEDFTIFIITKSFKKSIMLKGTEYNIEFVPLKSLFTGSIRKNELYYISTIEKTIFDCLLKPKFVGFSNITKALYDAKINWKELLKFFKLTNNRSLYQRTGYIFELMKKQTKLKVPNFILGYLLKKVKYPVKLTNSKYPSKFDKK